MVPPTFAPVVPPTFAPVVAPTFAPVPAPTFAPVPSPTLAPVPAPTLAPVTTPVAVPTGGGSSVNPLYPGDNGLTCECRFYSQDILLSSATDWASLSQSEMTGILAILKAMVPEFDPFGFTRALADCSLRGGPCNSGGRELQPNAIYYALALTSQTRFGNPSTAPNDPYGITLVYEWEFCVDDPDFVGDYHEAFMSYLSNPTNLGQMESDVRNLGLSSLTEMTVPDQLDEVCSGSR